MKIWIIAAAVVVGFLIVSGMYDADQVAMLADAVVVSK